MIHWYPSQVTLTRYCKSPIFAIPSSGDGYFTLIENFRFDLYRVRDYNRNTYLDREVVITKWQEYYEWHDLLHVYVQPFPQS